MKQENTIYKILAITNSCRSITDIANRLFLSQPYVSKEIHTNELKYGVKLIRRKPLPIKLTKAGEILLKKLEQELELENQLEIDLAPYKTNQPNYVKVATNQPWTTLYGYVVYQKLHEKFPDINFELTEVTTDLAEKSLLTKEIDVFAGKTLNNPALYSDKVFSAQLYFLIPATSSLYSNQDYLRILTKKDLRQFNNQNFVSLTDDSFFQKLVDHMLIDNNVNQNKVVKVNNHLVATDIASSGAGIFVTSYDFAEKWIGVKPFNLVAIPKTFLNFELAVSYSNDASDTVKEVGKVMMELEKKYQKFLSETYSF